MDNRKIIYLDDAIDALEHKKYKKVKGYVGGLFYNKIIQNNIDALMQLPSVQPETYEEKLKEIADELSEKFGYLNTCPNERDIILGYLGVKRPRGTHCDTDCVITKCECNHHYTKLPSVQPEIIYCKDCIYYRWEIDMCDEPYSTARNVVHEDDYCSKAERRTDCNGRD